MNRFSVSNFRPFNSKLLVVDNWKATIPHPSGPGGIQAEVNLLEMWTLSSVACLRSTRSKLDEREQSRRVEPNRRKLAVIMPNIFNTHHMTGTYDGVSHKLLNESISDRSTGGGLRQ